jgi:hypothetical protein
MDEEVEAPRDELEADESDAEVVAFKCCPGSQSDPS